MRRESRRDRSTHLTNWLKNITSEVENDTQFDTAIHYKNFMDERDINEFDDNG